jgi:hypothetical protein
MNPSGMCGEKCGGRPGNLKTTQNTKRNIRTSACVPVRPKKNPYVLPRPTVRRSASFEPPSLSIVVWLSVSAALIIPGGLFAAPAVVRPSTPTQPQNYSCDFETRRRFVGGIINKTGQMENFLSPHFIPALSQA